MSDHALTLVYEAKTPIEAQLAKGLLVSEGLLALVPGEDLNDEFGAATRAAGTTATTVMVPVSQLERARELLADWQTAAQSGGLADDRPAAGESDS